ncbi:hypothetical protein AB0M48_08380 [Lentzea sp. NPDC051208]|uniref:hypothetical protein n=1 Tax=Lentzea sp. NPDC051208 TaxID=3154642 RepID=UPI00341CB5A2
MIFDVTADEGTYRAEMEHSRGAELSKKVSGAWTFKAKHTHRDHALPAHGGPLRAKTTDAAGNTGEVTIISAYKIAS